MLEEFQYVEGPLEALLTLWIAAVGLSFGSFLNVVIHRLPIMLERSWKRECRSYLELESEAGAEEPYNLVVPRSRCPECAKPIAAWENIPVLSYLALGGRCRSCRTPISIRP